MHLAESQLIPEGTSVLVGYSGGADSTCLLHLLHKAGIDVVAATLHHGQRTEADEELQRCEEFATSLGIAFLSGRADVPAMAAQAKIGIEEAGRNARKIFLRHAAAQTECGLIATGHTRDDQVETVLMRIARGTGIAGLGGIHPVREGFIRPILPFSRAETVRYCEENGLWFTHDSGNFDEAFTRVRIRQRITPEFESINPQFATAVERLAETARAEDEFLDRMAAGLLESAERPINGSLAFLTQDCELELDSRILQSSPDVLVRRAIRLACNFIGGTAEFHHIDLAMQRLNSQKSGSISIPETDVVMQIDAETVTIRRTERDGPFRFPLTVPGETISDVFGWKLTAESWNPGDFVREPGSLEVVIDADSARAPLSFRSVEPEDRMVPLGEAESRNLANMLASARLSQAARQRLPIIMDIAGPIWAPGVRLSERVKVTSATRRALRLRLEPLEPDPGS